MLFGGLMTIVQQELPIKIADNGKLGFVEMRACSIHSRN